MYYKEELINEPYPRINTNKYNSLKMIILFIGTWCLSVGIGELICYYLFNDNKVNGSNSL